MNTPYESMDAEKAGKRVALPPSGDTPTSNRGVGIRELVVSPHWASFTVWDSVSNVAEAYCEFFREEFDREWDEIRQNFFRLSQFSQRGYAACWDGADGSRLLGYPSAGEHCHLVLTGSVLEQYSPDAFVGFVQHYSDQTSSIVGGLRPRINVTRFDLAIDNCPFKPTQIRDALQAGNFRSKTRMHSSISSNSDTAYLGSKKSDKQMRVYDQRGPTRLELQFRRVPALELCLGLCERPPRDWPRYSLEVCRGFVDFVERGPNISQSPLTPWWKKFVGLSGRVTLGGMRDVPPSLLRLERHLSKNASGLRAICIAKGIDPTEFLNRFPISDKHRRLLHSSGIDVSADYFLHDDDDSGF